MGFYAGIDVGGTFTDCVVVDEAGEIQVFKIPTVREEPARGFVECLKRAAGSLGLSLEEFLGALTKLTYGTTIATNLLIEGKAARTGLITTRGFRDMLIVQRTGREYMGIDLQVERPAPLTPRSLIEEVPERVDAAGAVVTPLDMQEVRAAIERLTDKGAESFAVSLLWAFKNPAHERMIREAILDRHPGAYVSLSSEIAPQIGEYERTATAVMNASLRPPIARHLDQLSQELREKGMKVPLLLMQSTGGVTPADDASIRPVTLVTSGPAGGVIASKYIGELMGLQNLVCIDMGGTSLDASLLTEGRYSSSVEVRAFNNTVYVPMIDIHTMGAGGGSIAWVDMGRRLKVGPHSAGAQPGPACYGLGGDQPTVTDADVILGRINPAYFLGGEMPLDVGRAEKAIAEKIAEPLGMSVVEAACGICQVVDANMADAIRAITLQKGYDPREYTLVAFGGAGPTHAASIALELGIGTVVIPCLAPVQSAFGIMASDVVHSFSISDVMPVDDIAALNRRYAQLEEQGLVLLDREGFAQDSIEIIRQAEMRYQGQVHEVTVPVPSGNLSQDDVGKLIAAFEHRYQTLYGRGTAFSEAGYQIVTLRVDAVGRTRKPVLPRMEATGEDAGQACKTSRHVIFGMQSMSTSVYDGHLLAPGNVVSGPAVVEYMGTTAVIPPGMSGRVDPHLNLLIERTLA